MLLVSIIILFCLLALGLLALLDRYDAAILKAQVARRKAQVQKFNYYDAFTDRRQQPGKAPPEGTPERRRDAAA